jgi:hypothetical protein
MKMKFVAKKVKVYPTIVFNKDNKSGNDKSAVQPLKKKAGIQDDAHKCVFWIDEFDDNPDVNPDCFVDLANPAMTKELCAKAGIELIGYDSSRGCASGYLPDDLYNELETTGSFDKTVQGSNGVYYQIHAPFETLPEDTLNFEGKTKRYPTITFHKKNQSGNDKSAVQPLKKAEVRTAEKSTKCVDCGTPGTVKDMVSNNEGAGYVCNKCFHKRRIEDDKAKKGSPKTALVPKELKLPPESLKGPQGPANKETVEKQKLAPVPHEPMKAKASAQNPVFVTLEESEENENGTSMTFYYHKGTATTDEIKQFIIDHDGRFACGLSVMVNDGMTVDLCEEQPFPEYDRFQANPVG